MTRRHEAPAPATDAERPIPSQVCRLRDAVELNRQLVEELAGRLDVLIPGCVRPETEPGPPGPPSMSPLAVDLSAVAESVYETNEGIRYLIDQIEV